MKAISPQRFAQLCRSDPDIHAQMLAIPKTITAEKMFALAECNGYRILPVQSEAGQKEIECLSDEALGWVSGGTCGMSEEEMWNAFHVWMYHIMGFGDQQMN